MLFALDPHTAYELGADFEDLVDAYRALAPMDRPAARELILAAIEEVDRDSFAWQPDGRKK